jgi:2-keto-3-deoxy-L-rhamnonate aldolase RhmA
LTWFAAGVRAYIEQGFRLVAVGSDDAFLMDGSRRILDGLDSLR